MKYVALVGWLICLAGFVLTRAASSPPAAYMGISAFVVGLVLP